MCGNGKTTKKKAKCYIDLHCCFSLCFSCVSQTLGEPEPAGFETTTLANFSTHALMRLGGMPKKRCRSLLLVFLFPLPRALRPAIFATKRRTATLTNSGSELCWYCDGDTKRHVDLRCWSRAFLLSVAQGKRCRYAVLLSICFIVTFSHSPSVFFFVFDLRCRWYAVH